MDEKPPEKKSQLNELNKDELLVKCKNLLVIAKKAKASKDDVLEEIKSLKEKLMNNEEEKASIGKSISSLNELVESLTQNKLSDAIKIESLNQKLLENERSYEKKMTRLSETEIENVAFGRQIKRLSDENESLLEQLQQLDDKLNSKEKLETLRTEENRRLKDILEKNSSKIRSLIQENSDLKETLEPDTNQPKDQLKIKYEKCIAKLKLYREKIFTISDKLIQLKTEREVLLKTSKEYSQCISQWQTDIANASLKMIERINDSNKQFKVLNEENTELKSKIDALKSKVEDTTIIENMKQEIQTLKESLTKAEKHLTDEKDAYRKLKQAPKKTSVLDLEIEAYEKTLDDLNKKLENKKCQDKEFENTIKVQNETIDSLKSQITSLEALLSSEKLHSMEMKKQHDSQQNLLRKTEHERTEIHLQHGLLQKSYESLKLENGEIKLQMSNEIGSLQKRYQTLEAERDENLKHIFLLESDMEAAKNLSHTQEREIEDLRSEFASYKLRAQSVLRQSQTKDLSKEIELQDEIKTLQKTIENSKDSNLKKTQDVENLKKSNEDLSADKISLQQRCKELIESMERCTEEALEESRHRNKVQDESIKAYQLQIETLNAFYKKKIQENEIYNNSTILGLNDKISKLEKSLQVMSLQPQSSFDMFEARNEEHKISMLATEQDLLTQRTEAEGSEDQSTNSSTFQSRRKSSKSARELMPLDELLNSSFEVQEDNFSSYSIPLDNFEQTKSKLIKEENRVAHLTSLLSESEKDLARMEQLNEMLKEEIRRQQRNFDREEHTKNSEYLKNIVIKFLTLNNGDEKQRLVPVLNTILKLSSEENTLLQNACKGGWKFL